MFEIIIKIIVGLILFLFVVYPIGAFVFAPFIIPGLRNIRYQEINGSVRKKLKKIVNDSKNKEEVLKRIFFMVIRHLDSGRNLQFKKPHKLFATNVDKVWEEGGVQSCNVQTMVLANFLYASGQFSKDEIQLKTTYVFNNIHKYLLVKVNGKEINLDPWAFHYSLDFGDYAHGFMPNTGGYRK